MNTKILDCNSVRESTPGPTRRSSLDLSWKVLFKFTIASSFFGAQSPPNLAELNAELFFCIWKKMELPLYLGKTVKILVYSSCTLFLGDNYYCIGTTKIQM